jgi:hypothetical protein
MKNILTTTMGGDAHMSLFENRIFVVTQERNAINEGHHLHG